MAEYVKAIKLPSGDVFPFSATTSVQLVPKRGVVVRNGGQMAWVDMVDITKAELVRDALVSIVLDIRNAVQPDWKLID